MTASRGLTNEGGKVFKRCSTCGGDVNAKPRGGKPAKHAGCPGTASSWTFMVDVAPVGAPREQGKMSGLRTKKKALAAMGEVQSSVETGSYIGPSLQTVGQYLSQWLAGIKAEYAPGTWDAARLHIESYILAHIGSLPLVALTTPRIKAMYADLAESGRLRGGGGLSDKTVHNFHRTLSRALNDAAAESPPHILRNPAKKRTKRPRRRSRRYGRSKSCGCSLQAATIIDCFQCGGTVSRRQLKGKRGRSVAIDGETVAALRSHRKSQAVEWLAWPGQWGNPDDLVFTHARGRAAVAPGLDHEDVQAVGGGGWVVVGEAARPQTHSCDVDA